MLATLIKDLKERDIRLNTREGKLTCSAPPGALTPELKQRIAQAKSELLEMMTGAEQSVALADPIERATEQNTYPLSSAQRRSAMTGHPKARLPAAFRLNGPIKIELLNETLNRFVKRHAPLRSRFELSGQSPCQHVVPYQRFELPVTKLNDSTDTALKDALERLQDTELDPQQGICFRFELLNLSAEEHVLFAAFSPLVFDGWSFDLLWRELTEGYAALAADKDWPFALLEHSYADCSRWLNKRIEQRKKTLTDFWQNHLGENLPLDVFQLAGRPDADQNTISLPFSLNKEAAQLVRQFAAKAGVTPQVVLLAGIYVWAWRLRGVVEPIPDDPSALDIILGIAVEGRPHVALENVVGPFANLILLRESPTENTDFMTLVKQIQNDLLSAHQHQELPLDQHQIRSTSGSTRSFQIEFSFQQTTGRSERMGPLRIQQVELRSGTSAVDLTFWVKDWGERISGAVEFRAGAFEQQAVEQWIKAYYFLLASMLKEPDAPVSQHNLLAKQEIAQIENNIKEQDTAPVDKYQRTLAYGVPGQIPGRDGLYVLHAQSGLEALTAQSIETDIGTDYQWPQTDTEVRLEILLQDILGQRIGVQADFFASGLNSLLALRFIERCQQEMGIPVSVPILFEHSSIAVLAVYIDSGELNIDAKMLVPLQAKGDLSPLYCICGINLYRRLAIALGKDQPTYAIYVPQERNLLSDKNSSTTADLAQIYWQTIRHQHMGETLKLLGFCYGGALAYEVARLARAEGLIVEHLVLVDTALSRRMSRHFRSRLAQRLPSGIRNRLKQLLKSGSNLNQQAAAENTINQNVLEALSLRLDDYIPTEIYDGETTMVDSGDPELYAAWKKTPQAGWEGTLVGPVHYINLLARHDTVLEAPQTEKIAETLARIFSGSGA